MESTEHAGLDEITFRPFLPWFLIKNAALLLIGVGCLSMAIAQGSVFWFLGVALAALAAAMLAARYAAQVVIVRGGDLILRWGLLSTDEHAIPIRYAKLETPQNLLGRIFDYGTVRYRRGAHIIELRMIASIRALRLIVAERRQRPASQVLERQVIVVGVTNGLAGNPGSHIPGVPALPPNLRH